MVRNYIAKFNRKLIREGNFLCGFTNTDSYVNEKVDWKSHKLYIFLIQETN